MLLINYLSKWLQIMRVLLVKWQQHMWWLTLRQSLHDNDPLKIESFFQKVLCSDDSMNADLQKQLKTLFYTCQASSAATHIGLLIRDTEQPEHNQKPLACSNFPSLRSLQQSHSQGFPTTCTFSSVLRWIQRLAHLARRIEVTVK